MSGYGWGWKPYVPVAVRHARAQKKMAELRKKGLDVQPVEIEGRTIARTFWGRAWCDHLESFSDFENRLPRGRTYVRNGSVCHLSIVKGGVAAIVSGSELYQVKVTVKMLAREKWKDVKQRCAGQIGSLIELLRGRLSENVMAVVTDRNQGLFPSPQQLSFKCNCPDWAVMCKHIAAVLYGVGSRLDEKPNLLFLLRGVDHAELISSGVDVAAATGNVKGGRKRIANDALSDVFGIEMSEDDAPAQEEPTIRKKKTAKKKTAKKKTAAKKTAAKKTAAKKTAAKKTAAKKTAAKKTAAKKTAAKRISAKKTTTKKTVEGSSQPKARRRKGKSLNQNKLASNKPASNKLASNKLASNKPASNKLASNKPASNKSASNKSASNKPASNKPASNKPSSRKTGSRRTGKHEGKHEVVTGQAVARLRAKFGMSQNEFARLLGVSAPSIGNWERRAGSLNLQPRTRDAWNAAKKLTKRKAWHNLDGS